MTIIYLCRHPDSRELNKTLYWSLVDNLKHTVSPTKIIPKLGRRELEQVTVCLYQDAISGYFDDDLVPLCCGVLHLPLLISVLLVSDHVNS